jgi:hypothetical protein
MTVCRDPRCKIPAHGHGNARGRMQSLMNFVISNAEIPHGGYIAYEVAGHDDHLHIGAECTGDITGKGRAPVLVAVFLQGVHAAAEQFWHGQDPEWTEEDGDMIRPAGLLVKHRARSLALSRRPLSQGVMAVGRDLTFHVAYGHRRHVSGWQHATADPGGCICVMFREAAKAMWPTCREPV